MVGRRLCARVQLQVVCSVQCVFVVFCCAFCALCGGQSAAHRAQSAERRAQIAEQRALRSPLAARLPINININIKLWPNSIGGRLFPLGVPSIFGPGSRPKIGLGLGLGSCKPPTTWGELEN